MNKLALALVPALACASVLACSHEDEPAGVVFTISGEDTAATGYAFPPASADDLAVVDGWEISFTRLLVTVDDIVLTETPDLSPTDQSQTGPVVARAKGPWAVNLSVPGRVETPPLARPSSVSLRPLGGDHSAEPITGRGSSDDKSVRLVRLEGQNARGGEAFDPAARYGLGYRLVTASPGAARVNFDADTAKAYDEMIAQGYSTWYEGTAVWKGTPSCTSSDPAYDWSRVPKNVTFKLGFKTPVTYANCQNTDLKGKAFEGEEAQRGIQIARSGTTYAQLTFHLEHAFWDTVDHDQAKPFFDQMAVASKNGVVTAEDLATLDVNAFTDADGKALPWRSCLPSVPAASGTRRFDPGSVPVVGKSGDPATGLRSYGDFVAYQQSTMGHLNADGLCAVTRGYASPK